MSMTESFVLEYLALPEGSAEREVLERRFGRNNIRKLVMKYEEEQANKQWLEHSTMSCPSCHVHVEKSLGCNHVSRLTVRCGRHTDLMNACPDDLCKVQDAFLLSLWGQAAGEQSVYTLQHAGTQLLLEVV